ncbi:MAG: flagellar protein FliT [Lachnospiraceae bacterium]|nr:flagellar protein FliT [Lachnospiraceae bacterium]
MMNSYLQILQDGLKKKLEVLVKIEEKSRRQAFLLKEEKVSFEAIDKNMDEKAALIEELENLDSGFESLYEKIRDELIPEKEKYREEIRSLQELIARVTERSASIQAIEARNKSEMEMALSREKKVLQSKRNAMSVATDYYQNMNKVKNVGPQFLDKKK